MYSFKNIMIAMLLLLSAIGSTQIKNPIKANIQIYGSCGMCKNNIEQAGNQKNIVAVDWDKNTKIASITYDSKKTNTDQILKRIALAGYDSSSFLAPASAYAKLSDCCKYTRDAKKTEPKSEIDTTAHNTHNETVLNPLQEVYDAYFTLKDAFIQSNSTTVSAGAKALLILISSVKTESLSAQEQKIWMKINASLITQSSAITKTNNIEKQREIFKELFKTFYELIKNIKIADPVYYQYCPMADANWLSKESAVKNPYYGSQMLTCGKTVEIIK
ncbi:DUF3347 domain-containing protein [Flavobacterium marginilacus]|uniref:DUF3347 domain-containing protein n=1 Tax=Flavobacterium marginilacus TaxID=3003256 RepID=UPI00248F1A6B|nr:DUF3347 domain-containing protein [Flavobacterium marginilacus]